MKKIIVISSVFLSMNVISQEVSFQAEKLWAECTSANQYNIHKSDTATWNVFVVENPE